MASSADQDKDTSSNDTQSKPDNPFIKFRQFADTHISSLLQGIIGLPSALSNRSSHDPRWAVIDDGLRRRDELQARQKELKESEARKPHRQSPLGQGTSAGTDNAYISSEGYQPLGQREYKDGPPTMDLPLYSAVKKSLFANLPQTTFDDADWSDLKTPLISIGNEFLSKLQLTHYVMYHNNGDSMFRSKYSLLPYLMFSPYSPIGLETTAPEEDVLDYCMAFEELILTAQTTTVASPWQRLMSDFIRQDTGTATANLDWIWKLHMIGILQEAKDGEDDRDHELICHRMHTILLAQRNNRQRLEHEENMREEEQSLTKEQTSVVGSTGAQGTREDEFQAAKTPMTEQEMYDHFLKWASSPQPFKDVFQAGEAFLSSLENNDMSGKKRDQEEGQTDRPSLMKEILEATKAFRQLSRAEGVAFEPDQNERLDAKSAEKSDRVVSSSTTTEQTVHEDGSVETSVTVWKKFSSGRETSTKTHHCEDPAMSERSQVEENESSAKDSESVMTEGAGNKNGKSGWFWN